MNGAVARVPVSVFTSTLSLLVNVPSLFVSYAGPPENVNAYNFASGAVHGVMVLNVVVVKKTMSPATAGNAVTRSSVLNVVDLASGWEKDCVPVAPPTSSTAISL